MFLLERLESQIATGTGVPTTRKVLVDKDAVLELIDQLRVAVVGIRGRGQSHIDAFSKNKATTVAALCDVDAKVLDRGIKAVESKTGKACTFFLRVRLDGVR